MLTRRISRLVQTPRGLQDVGSGGRRRRKICIDDDKDENGLRLLRKTGGSLRAPLVVRSIPLSMWSNWIADDKAPSPLDAPVRPLADGRESVWEV
jgi:hypothetical protein